jgi:hypothetical protein
VTLDGRSDALSSANRDGDVGADSACSSGTLSFLTAAGAEGGVTGVGSGGSWSGLVRHLSLGVAGLLPPPPPPPPPLEEKKPPARGLASRGRRFLALAATASSSSRWTDVHSALRHPVPIFPSSAAVTVSWRREETGGGEGGAASALFCLLSLLPLSLSLIVLAPHGAMPRESCPPPEKKKDSSLARSATSHLLHHNLSTTVVLSSALLTDPGRKRERIEMQLL